jgi:hypothetical protein
MAQSNNNKSFRVVLDGTTLAQQAQTFLKMPKVPFKNGLKPLSIKESAYYAINANMFLN